MLNPMLAILDYDAGNVESVRLAFRHVGGRAIPVRDAEAASRAARIVFPGVGSAGQCMRALRERGFDTAIRSALQRRVPILAVCIGMQLLFDGSEEDGGVATLGLLPGRVRRFRPAARHIKVPHMGWNRVTPLHRHPLFPHGSEGGDFYFVHSFYCEPAWNVPDVAHSLPSSPRTPGTVYGATEYGGCAFTATAGTGSLFACQFHPEKSGEAGLGILRRFLEWNGQPC